MRAICGIALLLTACTAEQARRFNEALLSPQAAQGVQTWSNAKYGGGYYAAPPPQCPYVRQWTSGMYRTCVYNCMGSPVTTTVSAASLCPLSTPLP